jgi:predicted nucleic acid-binding protein
MTESWRPPPWQGKCGQNALLLIDEFYGRQEATRIGLNVIGTLGILQQIHLGGLLNISDAINRLQKTNFKAPDALIQGTLNLQ